MYHLKLEIELTTTILSVNEFHILITFFLKFLLRSETIGNLANLNIIPQVDGYCECVKNMKTQNQPGHVEFCNT
jgi:hypothetical protein